MLSMNLRCLIGVGVNSDSACEKVCLLQLKKQALLITGRNSRLL